MFRLWKRLLRASPGALIALGVVLTFGQPLRTGAASASAMAAAAVKVNPATGSNSDTKLSVGQTIAITRPEEYDEWQVDFDAAALNALTSPERMRAPGAQGWLFRAVKPGETRVILTSIPPRCSKEAPCPHLDPQRFGITVQVQP